jgi:hypothetical protein
MAGIRYSSPHQRERATWEPVINAGQGICAQPVCIKPSRHIKPGTPWDLAHTADGTAYHGPAHMACNRRDGGIRGNKSPRRKLRRARRLIASPYNRW